MKDITSQMRKAELAELFKAHRNDLSLTGYTTAQESGSKIETGVLIGVLNQPKDSPHPIGNARMLVSVEHLYRIRPWKQGSDFYAAAQQNALIHSEIIGKALEDTTGHEFIEI